MLIRMISLFVAGAWLAYPVHAQEWKLPPDKGTLSAADVKTILGGNEYPETTSYTRRTEYLDFTAYGQSYTQVVVTLVPQQPRLYKGRKLVVVGAEPGSEYAMDFLETVEGKEGMGAWLARRGVTFIALTRVGRWNFLDPSGDGSWQSIPLDSRMPIYNRGRKAYWSSNDYATQKSTSTAVATGGDSAIYRIPEPGTALYNETLAATPVTIITGYRLAIERALPPSERSQSYLLYWGMSTGGAFLYPLAKHLKPDGYLGWGTSSTGLAYLHRRAKQGNFDGPYARSAVRIRERGMDDFEYYTKHVPSDVRERWWQVALKQPRFKSVEDPPMQFNVAAMTEVAMRLWLSDFLPSEYRKDGLAKFIQDILETSFPPAEMKGVAVLDMNGTRDEAIPPRTVDAHREVMETYAGRYRVARIQDFHHYLFTQDSIKTVGTVWLKFIDSGYFDL
jgi:hypothetical protein